MSLVKAKSEKLKAHNKIGTLSKLILDLNDQETESVPSVSVDGQSICSDDNSIMIAQSPSQISSNSVNSPYSKSRSAKIADNKTPAFGQIKLMTLKKEMPSTPNVYRNMPSRKSNNDIKSHSGFLTIEPASPAPKSNMHLDKVVIESTTPKVLARKHTFQFGAL